jgi:hypothetical protein
MYFYTTIVSFASILANLDFWDQKKRFYSICIFLFQAAIFAVNKLFQATQIECPVFVSIFD